MEFKSVEMLTKEGQFYIVSVIIFLPVKITVYSLGWIIFFFHLINK